MDILDYLRGNSRDLGSREEIIKHIDRLKENGLFFYFDRDETFDILEDAFKNNPILCEHARRIKEFRAETVGSYKVTISENEVEIGCKTFNKTKIRMLIKAYDDGVVIKADNVINLRVKHIPALNYAVEQNISMFEDSFWYNSVSVDIERIRKWVSTR